MRILLIFLTSLLLVACNDPLLSLTPAPALAQEAQPEHMITLEVYPHEAEVIVYRATEPDPEISLMSVRRDTGPVALFYLPEGSYRYLVRAPGYESFRGELEIPRNKSLAVWLDTASY